jgi:hypothetical protein
MRTLRNPRSPWDAEEDFELVSPPSPMSSHSKLERLVKHLKDNYKPRCMASRETLEDHMRYAGAVQLAQNILRDLEGGS